MADSMKQRLREQKKKNHEAFRQQLVRDVAEQLEEWSAQRDRVIQEQSRQLKRTLEEIEQATQEAKRVATELDQIRYNTMSEIKRFKRGRSWKFYGACFGASLAGSLTAIIICGNYWPTIQHILG
ncbi:MAG TPA: hypothetical protein VK074_07155 [Fodinibius sp.]|nr:hypothetical protein [Fodinibius sp.]